MLINQSFHDQVGEDDEAAAGPPIFHAIRQVEVRDTPGPCTAPVCTNANSLPTWIQEMYEGVGQVPAYKDFR